VKGSLAGHTELLARDERRIPIDDSAAPIQGETGAVLGGVVVFRDVTPQRQQEEQFRQAQKLEMVGRLAGGVAHEFNNLLSVINGYTNLVLSSLHPHDRHRELLEEVLRAGERAVSLTQQLLAYSRQQMLQPRVVDLNELVRGTEKTLRCILGEDIELRIATGENLDPIKVDPVQMEQVLLNLVINARDALPAGGALTIETTHTHLAESRFTDQARMNPGPYTVLTVTDTGCGMDEGTLRHIFEPFFTTKEQGKGTGLGLAMVWGTVKQSGGHVEVESRPGRGTTFRLYLPGIEEISAEERQTGPDHMPGGTKTVLLVEDEQGVRKLAAHLLGLSGYKVLEAENGPQALEIIAHYPRRIDLLVSDVVMPGMSGPQVAEAVKIVHPSVKVLFPSGYSDDALQGHGVAAGEQNFLQKPFTLADLARTVREVLGRP
jgi:signal transduction histidine kinase